MNPLKTNECIIVANGPSLDNVPIEFLNSRKSFGMNAIHLHKEFKPTYWCCCDDETLIRAIPFVIGWNKHLHILVAQSYMSRGWPWKMGLTIWEPDFEWIEGYSFSRHYGLKYSTTTAFACHIAWKMGYRRMFLVGFDCTGGPRNDSNPHFYDSRTEAEYASIWDTEMGRLNAKLGDCIINLSEPTESKTLPKGNWEDYMR